MSQNMLKLLENLDDLTAEYPSDWTFIHRQVAEHNFIHLTNTLAHHLHFSTTMYNSQMNNPKYDLLHQNTLIYETGSLIQDASFHGQIILPHSLLTETAIRENDTVTLRISNFGRLATIYEDDSMVQSNILALIINVLEENNYIYAPTSILNIPYSGINPNFSNKICWRDRYFEWM